MDILDQEPLGEEDDDLHGALLSLVTRDSAFRGGKPYIREAGLTVSGILHMIANGWTTGQILEEYPRARPDHIRAALLYAARGMD